MIEQKDSRNAKSSVEQVPFEVYLTQKDILLITEDDLLWKIRSSLENGWSGISEAQQKELLGHFRDLLDTARHYHRTYQNEKVVSSPEPEEISPKERAALIARVEGLDAARRAAHNTLVDSINILSRRMKEFGLDNSWRGNNAIHSLDEEGTRKKVAQWVFHLYHDDPEEE